MNASAIGLAIGYRRSAIRTQPARALFALFLCTTAATLHAAAPPPPPLVSLGADRTLKYDADSRGNRVPDFSSCGYAGGDQSIPNAPVRVVVEPKSGDSTLRIQRAIDYVASLPADTNGLRGAVLLLKGRHEVLGSLRLDQSGVVLRGQGMGENGTVLVATGLDRRTLIRIAGQVDFKAIGKPWALTEEYLPAGATSFRLPDGQELKTGDELRIVRLSTSDWIKRLGADEFGGGEGGGWKPGTRDLAWLRTVKSVAGDVVTLDAPITTALEQQLGGGLGGARVQVYAWPGQLRNVGVENLRFESTFDAANPKDENHSWCAVTMESAGDAWVRQVTFKHFAGSAVALYETCQRVTVQDCVSLEPVSEVGGYRRHTFFTMGQQTLFLRCYAERGRHDFAAGHCAAGPNAFVQCQAVHALGDSGPIESWASGVLYDNVVIDGDALTLGYRPGNNAAIGWSAANCVLWNCSAAIIRCSNPPGAQNWAFGSWAGFEGDGTWRNSNEFARPESLYLAQLADRLGREAAARVPFLSRPTAEATNPTIEQAAQYTAAALKPPPLLVDFIVAASKRDPIPAEAGEAKRVEQLTTFGVPPSSGRDRLKPELQTARKPLVITNGWITCDGKLLVGGVADISWWRGNVRPSEAPSFGLSLTRFVPGRTGPGFTDDLNDIAASMAAGGDVALDHHYGLWYDRRRDDHQRVRRMTGDVLPPFFEQPFARSGLGSAWDGLSQYDLTKFNPWYWSRLKQFADLCDQRGLVLFHENYFQHNIIEAGAHWVDCPWRTANNVNDTGFPEPPPFAGDKRIFLAEQFYDVTNSVRRALHRGFIRQCLQNFKDHTNVIHFTSAEFTGPLHFMQFWLDTVADWERDLRRRPIIALAATKDVQDAILAETKRAAVVDVVVFRYWWQTDKGLFAPNGGQDLSPRQFQRQWRGGAPTDANLAAMASEYRRRFPRKPVIAAGEQGADLSHGNWAFVCAGGSLPNLPRATDARLLAAIPRMQPWTETSTTNRWSLREAGKQILIYSGADRELDLSSEPGVFRVNVVNPKSGEIAPGETLNGGGKVTLPDATVIWLVKEK